MTRELGSYNTATTRTHVRFQFSTHAAAGGNVAPSTAFEAADIRIYRAADGAAYSATQRSSSNGITMTSPFDSLTGVHDVDIDLTDNTDSGFYAAGYRYSVVLSPDETVDSQTITGVVLGEFEIGPPPANVTQVSGDATAADNAEAFFDGTGYAGTNNVIPTVTTLTGHTAQTGDSYAIVNSGTHGNAALKTLIDAVDNILDTEFPALVTTIGTPAGASIAADLVVIDDFVDALESRLTAARAGYLDNLSAGAAALETTSQTILADTNELQTDWVNGGRLDLLIDAILADTDSLDTTKITTARAAVLADWIDGGRLDLILDARASQTSVDAIDDILDTEFPALTSTVGSLFTTARPQSYRSAGATATIDQMLYETIAQLGDCSISGTTKTLNNLAGSAAKTFALNSSTLPTSITELS